MTLNTIATNYSAQLEQYGHDGNICAFLNITSHSKSDVDRLADKFASLEAAGFNLTSFSSSFLWTLLFPSIVHQSIVAECAYHDYVAILKSKSYYDSVLVYFMEKGYLSPIWPWIVFPSSVAVLAILFNISLLIVTARKISLSKLCNWLIAFDSFCQIPALLPFLVNLFAVCGRLNAVDYRVCLTTLMVSTGSSYASFLAVYFMSLERLLIVAMPMRMNQISDSRIKCCSSLSFLVCICFGAAMTLYTFNVWTIINLQFSNNLYCNTGLYSDVLNTAVSYVVLGLALANYVLISVLIVWRRSYLLPKTMVNPEGPAVNNENNAATAFSSQVTRRMLRSVFLLSIVVLLGWLVGSAARNQITTWTRTAVNATAEALFSHDPAVAAKVNYDVSSWAIGVITCMFIVAAGINAPVLIINNSEYRKAYKRTFLKLLTRKSTSTGPLFTAIRQ